MREHGALAEDWFAQSRESRNFMTSAFTARQLIDAMTKDDQLQEMERERKKQKPRSATRRPRPRGRR